MPFIPSLGFHRLGLGAELSPPIVQGSVRIARPGLVREYSFLGLSTLHSYESEMGGGMNVTTLGTCARRRQLCFSRRDKSLI